MFSQEPVWFACFNGEENNLARAWRSQKPLTLDYLTEISDKKDLTFSSDQYVFGQTRVLRKIDYIHTEGLRQRISGHEDDLKNYHGFMRQIYHKNGLLTLYEGECTNGYK